MDLNFLEEFFSGYGKWDISFQQLRLNFQWIWIYILWAEGFLEESQALPNSTVQQSSLTPETPWESQLSL